MPDARSLLHTPDPEPADGVQASGTSLTQELVRIVCAKPITEADRKAASALTLDAIACALAGRLSEPANILRSWYRALDPSGLGQRDPGRRAFIMGGLIHALEIDDLHRASVVHPGCVVIPAAWTTARQTIADGRTYLDAVIRGFEVACRVGMAVGGDHYKVWHNTATCGTFGAAMAAGSLLELDEERLVHALGNAGTQSSGLWEFLDSGAMSKHLHAGRAAESGWMAASLAAEGFTGPPRILEGERGFFRAACPDADPDALLADPDGPWAVHQTSIKPWPCCRHTHAAIDAAQDLRRQLAERGVDANEIGAIHVRTYPAAIDVCDRISPRTDYEAKFSMQHCVAAALGQDQVTFESFDAQARRSLAPIRARVTLMTEPKYEDAYPQAWGATVSMTLRDGSRIDASREHAKGDPEAPLSARDMETKARLLLEMGDVPQPDDWIELLLRIDEAPTLPELHRFWAMEDEPPRPGTRPQNHNSPSPDAPRLQVR